MATNRNLIHKGIIGHSAPRISWKNRNKGKDKEIDKGIDRDQHQAVSKEESTISMPYPPAGNRK